VSAGIVALLNESAVAAVFNESAVAVVEVVVLSPQAARAVITAKETNNFFIFWGFNFINVNVNTRDFKR
jgi:hypothetical protein